MRRHCGGPVLQRGASHRGDLTKKKHLGKIADAVEMESFEIVAAATDAGVPAVAIRAVSDTSKSLLPLDMNRSFQRRGAVEHPASGRAGSAASASAAGSCEAGPAKQKGGRVIGAVPGSLHRTDRRQRAANRTEGSRSVRVAAERQLLRLEQANAKFLIANLELESRSSN